MSGNLCESVKWITIPLTIITETVANAMMRAARPTVSG
jgi:hypothetical protein